MYLVSGDEDPTLSLLVGEAVRVRMLLRSAILTRNRWDTNPAEQSHYNRRECDCAIKGSSTHTHTLQRVLYTIIGAMSKYNKDWGERRRKQTTAGYVACNKGIIQYQRRQKGCGRYVIGLITGDELQTCRRRQSTIKTTARE